MLEVCFHGNLCNKLKMFRNESNIKIGDPIEFPDYLPVGKISPYDSASRLSELKKNGLQLNPCFIRDNDSFKKEFLKHDKYRFWISKYNNDILGLCYVSSLIQNQKIWVCSTEKIPSLQNISTYEIVENSQIELLLKNQFTCDSTYYKNIWLKLQKENTSLRIQKNNQIISVESDYFDSVILSTPGNNPYSIADKIFYENDIIQQSEICYSFFLHRICYLHHWHLQDFTPELVFVVKQ